MEERNRQFDDEEIPNETGVNYVYNVRTKPPMYEHGKIGVCVWIDQVETWVATNHVSVAMFFHRYLITCFNDPVVRDWVLRYGLQSKTWNEFCTDFRGSWRDREYEESLGNQATTVRQADGEDILAFLLKKQAQFEYYCPKLLEVQRTETTLRLMLAKYSMYFTGNYSCMSDLVRDAPAVKSRVGMATGGKTPRSFSLDPHVVVQVDEERKPHKRLAQSQLPLRKYRSDALPKKTTTVNVAGRTAHPFPNPTSKVTPATSKTQRPQKAKVFAPQRKVNAADLRCYKCQGTGHYARDCTQPAARKDTDKMVSMLRTLMLENNQDPDTLNLDLEPSSEDEIDSSGQEYDSDDDSLDGDGMNVGADLMSEN
jgi:hypothetical protein